MSERLSWWTVKTGEGVGSDGPDALNWQAESQARNDARRHESEYDGDAVVVGPQEDRPDPAAVLEEYRDSDDSEEPEND